MVQPKIDQATPIDFMSSTAIENYKVSSGWSYKRALEKVRNQGKSREAIMAKQLAWS
jgi:hypothetical protein